MKYNIIHDKIKCTSHLSFGKYWQDMKEKLCKFSRF